MADLVGKPFPEIIGRRCWEVVHGTTGPIDDCPMIRLRQSHQREESVLSVGESWFKVAVDPILDRSRKSDRRGPPHRRHYPDQADRGKTVT